MKSNIKTPEPKNRPFPKLMEHKKDRSFVVFMDSIETGVVVSKGDSDWNVGEYSRKWVIGQFHAKDFLE